MYANKYIYIYIYIKIYNNCTVSYIKQLVLILHYMLCFRSRNRRAHADYREYVVADQT